MHNTFFHFGKFLYQYKWTIITGWLIVIFLCLPFIPSIMYPFKSSGFLNRHSESARAVKILNAHLGYGANQFIVVYQSSNLSALQPKFINEVKDSLAGLKKFPIKHKIIYPATRFKQISADQHTAYAIVVFKSDVETDPEVLQQFKAALLKPPHLKMYVGGEAAFATEAKNQSHLDLYKGEYIATPIAFIAMLIIFGSIISAMIPVILGAIGTLITLVLLSIIGNIINLSIFTLNIAILLGLCLSLDYALVIISRFREELKNGYSTLDAIAITQGTAGKAVFFSGLAVAVSLSALFLFPVNYLYSNGIGGIVAVIVAVLTATILLPAVLAMVGDKIDRFPIKLFNFKKFNPFNNHSSLIKKVVTHPIIFFVGVLIFLLFLGWPILHIKFSLSDAKVLPPQTENRQVYEIFSKSFSESALSPITVVVKTSGRKIISPDNIYYLYDFAHAIAQDPRVQDVESMVTNEPRFTKTQYQYLSTLPTKYIEQFFPDLELTTHDTMTAFTVISKYPANSPETIALIKKIRHSDPGNGMRLLVTGASANTIDVLSSIKKIFPYALLLIIFLTYMVLLIVLRSLFLPFKAIVMNMLSLIASYGVLVFVFQQGHFHQLLNFQPLGYLDVSLLIVIFCGVFGISMDYEVFMLTRIKECYEKTQDNMHSIVEGTARSRTIITSSAIVIILICLSFMTADIVLIKIFGLGAAVAVFVDAFIIRILLVPATMSLFSTWNWYLPQWLDKLLPQIHFDVTELPANINKDH